MKAIVTKILPVTDTKPTRIKVSAEGVPHKVWSRDLIENELLVAGLPVNDRSIHHAAAVKFCGLRQWGAGLVSGGLPNGDWCHCIIPDVVPATLRCGKTLIETVSCSERFDGFHEGVLASCKALGL